MFDDPWPDRGQWSFWLVQRRGWPGSFCGNLRSEWLVHGPTLDFRESPAITILHNWIVLTYNDSDVSVMFRAISIHFKSQATPFILYIYDVYWLYTFSWDRLMANMFTSNVITRIPLRTLSLPRQTTRRIPSQVNWWLIWSWWIVGELFHKKNIKTKHGWYIFALQNIVDPIIMIYTICTICWLTCSQNV